jgi:hypothetical protein
MAIRFSTTRGDLRSTELPARDLLEFRARDEGDRDQNDTGTNPPPPNNWESTMSTIARAFPYDNALGNTAVPTPLPKEMSPEDESEARWRVVPRHDRWWNRCPGVISDRFVVTGDRSRYGSQFWSEFTLIRVAYAIFMIEMACSDLDDCSVL